MSGRRSGASKPICEFISLKVHSSGYDKSDYQINERMIHMAIKEKDMITPSYTEKQNTNKDNTGSQVQTVAEAILTQLSNWGVKHMYGVAGDATLAFMDEISKQDKIKLYQTNYESAAAFMASAEGKSTSRLAVCTGTSGPGLVNMLNGIADASSDHIPMLVITGQVETKKIGTEAKQYIEQQQMIAPLAVYSTTLMHPDAIVDVLQTAIIQAISKRGVAHISVPKDLFPMICAKEPKAPTGVLWNEKRRDLHDLERAVMHLASASKPMIMIGEGAREVKEDILRMADSLQAGIIESLGAKGTVPHEHLLNVGGIGHGGTQESRHLFTQADCVLVVGANWWPENFVPKQAKVIQIDTSAASIEGHPQIVCGLVGQAQEILPMLHSKYEEQKQNHKIDRKEWHEQVKQVKQKIVTDQDKERQRTDSPIAPQRLMAALDSQVAEDAIMVLDTGDHTVWYNKYFRAKNQSVLYSGKWRTMGFSLPAAISAKLNHPEKQVVSIIGDGCFMMTMMELATAVKYNIPIVAVVVNNGALAMEKNKMKANHMQPYATELTNPNFADVAKAFGANGVRVENEHDLDMAVQQALIANQPTVLEVLTSDEMPSLTGQ